MSEPNSHVSVFKSSYICNIRVAHGTGNVAKGTVYLFGGDYSII